MRRIVAAPALVMIVVALGACGTSEPSTSAPASTDTTVAVSTTMRPDSTAVRPMVVPEDMDVWSEFAISANWVESYPTVHETAAAADLAVIANVRSVVPLAPIPGDAPGSDIALVGLVMDVVADISGSGLTEFTLRLESPVEGEEYDRFIDDLATRLPTGSAFFALRQSEGDTYRIINSWGVWLMTDEGFVAPLDPDFEQNRVSFDDELRGISSYDDLALYLSTPRQVE